MSDQKSWQQPTGQEPVVLPRTSSQDASNAFAAQAQMPAQPQVAAYSYAPVSSFQYAQPQKKSGKGWIIAIVAIVALCAMVIASFMSCSAALGGLGAMPSDEAAYLTRDAVAIINVDGTIQYDGTTASPEGLKGKLDQAEKNKNIKAVVLRVDSGGGVATAGEEMALYVKEFSKPIVVSSASVNASAAYEISSQADYIYVAKTTAIGSIGTAMSFMDLSGLYEKLGIKFDDITSAESKDSSYGNRPLTEEERQYYQEMINEINETFIKTVAEGREMDTEAVRALATGLIFTGMTAVENGLADEIGTLEDACDKAAELAGISDYETVRLYYYSSLNMMSLLDLFMVSKSNQELLAKLENLEANGALAR